jgi:hypothetical protein
MPSKKEWKERAKDADASAQSLAAETERLAKALTASFASAETSARRLIDIAVVLDGMEITGETTMLELRSIMTRLGVVPRISRQGHSFGTLVEAVNKALLELERAGPLI